MQKEWLQDKIIEEIHRFDYFNLQKLRTFIDGFKSVKVQWKEGEGTYHEG